MAFDLRKWVSATTRRVTALSNAVFGPGGAPPASLSDDPNNPTPNLPDLLARCQQLESAIKVLAYNSDASDSVTTGTAVRPERAVPAIYRDPVTGYVYLNPIKSKVKPFIFRTGTPAIGQTIVVPASGQKNGAFIINPEASLDGMVEIFALGQAGPTNMSWRVRLVHQGLNKALMNQPCWGGAVFSDLRPNATALELTGPMPKFLRESIFLEPNQELTCECFDFSTAQNTLELYAYARKFSPGGPLIAPDGSIIDQQLSNEGLVNLFLSRPTFPYWVTQDSVFTSTNVTTAQNPFLATIDRAFNFEAMEIMKWEAVSGTETNIPHHVTVREGINGALLFDTVDHNAFAGNGCLPMPLLEPYLQPRGSPLAFTVTRDDTVATSPTIDYVLHGRAIPVSIPGQRTLTPRDDGQSLSLPPPSQRDLSYPRGYSS